MLGNVFCIYQWYGLSDFNLPVHFSNPFQFSRIAESPATEKPILWFARFISYGNKMFFQYAGCLINAWGVGYGRDMAV